MSFLLMLLLVFPPLCASDIPTHPADEPLLNERSLVTRLTTPFTMQELEEQVPLPHLVMAREAIKGRVHHIVRQQDLTPFSMEELVIANKLLRIEKIDGYEQWFDEHVGCVIGGLAGVACVPMAIGVTSAMAAAHYIGGAIGFLGTEGAIKTAMLSCLPVSGFSGLLFSSYYQPDQTDIEVAIERTDREIENRKEQNTPDQ